MPEKCYLYTVGFCDCLEHDQNEAHMKSALKSVISNFYRGSSIYTSASGVGESLRPWTSHFTSGVSVLSCEKGKTKRENKNIQHLHSSYYLPGTVLSNSMYSSLIFRTAYEIGPGINFPSRSRLSSQDFLPLPLTNT